MSYPNRLRKAEERVIDKARNPWMILIWVKVHLQEPSPGVHVCSRWQEEDDQEGDSRVITEGQAILQLNLKMELHSDNNNFLQLSKTFCCLKASRNFIKDS